MGFGASSTFGGPINTPTATELAASGLKFTRFQVDRDSVLQKPIEGTSFLYAFNDADAPERHKTQYFETFGNRGIYHEGWTAVTLHSKPWDFYNLPDYSEDVWELYFTYKGSTSETGPEEDWTQARNLAAAEPNKLEELKSLFQINAARYNVFALDDRKIERLPSGPPGQEANVTFQSYVDGSFVADPRVIDNFNRSFDTTARTTVPSGSVNGVGALGEDRREGPTCHREPRTPPARADGDPLTP